MKRLKRLVGRLLYLFCKKLPTSFSRFRLGQQRLRGLCGRLILKSCGSNVNIERNAEFDSSVSLGDNSGLGINATVGAGTIIGKNVMMGPNVKIYTQNHATSRTDIPMCEQGFKPLAPVVIEDDVWIGESVIILPGSHIGTGVILGAGAVVRGEVPEFAVVIGNPGTIIKYRGQEK